MKMHTSPLDHVRVAAPCPADWERMTGSERVRFCGQCSLNVYNLSGMSKREAEAFVTNAEGRVCVRFYRRADGTILTKNCPVGLAALRRRVGRVVNATTSAVLGFVAGLGLTTTRVPRRPEVMGVMAVTVPSSTQGDVTAWQGEPIIAAPDVAPAPEIGKVEAIGGTMIFDSETRGRLVIKRADKARGKSRAGR